MSTKYFEMSDARRDGHRNIGEAAKASGVSPKMIRHYEDEGLVPKAGRTVAGYRIYRDQDIHLLRFIRRARDLGFPLKEIKALVGLWNVALAHVAGLDARIAEMQAMRRELSRLAEHCHGDGRPDCPILEDLSGGGGHGAA